MAGYFDGDGPVEELIGDFVVRVRLGFSDNWAEQLRAVRRFLIDQGLRVGNLTRSRRRGIPHAWKLVVCNQEAVLVMADKMLPHVVKKRGELQAVVDYHRNRITGDEFVRQVNHEIAIGNKLGKVKPSHLPSTRADGNVARRRFSLSRAREANLIHVPSQLIEAIRLEYMTGGYTMRELSRRHGVAIWLVHRILGKHY